MHADLRVLDGDAHVIEPADVFGAAALESMDLPDTTPRVPCGDFELLADQFEHGFDAASYLRAMDRQGIDAAVLYPSMGLFVPFQPGYDAEASARACAAYNDWIAAYCDTDRTRLAGVGIVPLVDPGRAATEARRALELGLVGVLARPNHLYGRNLGDPVFDDLYAVLEQHGLVLAVHEGLGVRAPTIGSDRFDGFALRHALSHPMEQMAALASLFLEGTLERHPALKVAFLESGTGWLPYWLSRLDDHCEWMRDSETAGLTLTPSEYFARQCVISCDPEDKLAGWAVSRVGADHVIWASDFPHPDAAFPDAVDEFLADGGVAPADLPAVLWDTPLQFYGLADRFEVAGIPR
jgi:predicted TIM-barrel fold metal-dependent hydrolase